MIHVALLIAHCLKHSIFPSLKILLNSPLKLLKNVLKGY